MVVDTKKWRKEGSTLNWSPLVITFCCSLLAWPISFLYNNGVELIDQEVRPFWMMALGFVCLAAVGYVASKLSHTSDWLFVGIVIFAFSAVIDAIITLENSRVIQGFMAEYLKYGEPYLFCSWGTAACCFDAFGFFTMYLLIVFFLTNGKSWRSVGIYWSSGILNSMVVLLMGAIVGQVHTPTFCILLNVPFILFPIAVLVRAIGKEKRSGWTNRIQNSSIFLKLVDLALVLGFMTSIWVTLAKGLASYGCRAWPIWNIVRSGPVLFLEDPAPFAMIQANIYLFYVAPVQCLSLLYLFKREKPQFLWELSVIHAGVLAEAQFAFLFQCLSPETPSNYQSSWGDGELWIWNLLILIIPHLYLLRLWSHRQSNKSLEKFAEKQI